LSQAEELVLKDVPKKIVILDELLKTSQFNKKNLDEVHESLNIPVPEPIQLNKCWLKTFLFVAIFNMLNF
jgi:Proteasome activator pa28 alpha subunit